MARDILMRTCFEQLEIADYRETVFALVRLGGEWAVEVGRPAPDPWTLYCACDYQQFFGGGRLTCWSAGELRRLLLDWFPRYCAMPADGWGLVVPSLHAWLDFLDAHRLLDPGSEELPALHETLERTAEEFPAAMADASRYGIDKVIINDLRERGLRPGDPRLFDAYLEDWRTGHAEAHLARLERAAAVEAAHAGEVRRGPRPLPVWLPDEQTLTAQARSIPVVAQLLRLAEWAGESGRALTASGRLKPADAAELVRLLDTGDILAPSGKVRSAGDLPQLTLLLEWAKSAGFVRRHGGRLVRVKAARHVLDRPLLAFSRAFTALFGMREALFPPKTPITSFYGCFPDALRDTLFAVYGLPEPGVDPVLLGESVWQACARRFGRDAADPQHARERVNVVAEFRRTLDVLVRLGAARRCEVDSPADAPAATPVRLTELGTWSVRNRLLATGQRAPLVGELADADAHTLLYRLAEDYDTVTGRLELACWLAARGCDAPPPDGPLPYGLAPDGLAPDGLSPNGLAPDGLAPDGLARNGVSPDGLAPDEPDPPETPATHDGPTMSDTPAELAARAELADALAASPLRTRKALLLRILIRSLPERHRFAESLLDSGDLGPTAVAALLESGHRTMGELAQHEAFGGVAESMAQVLEVGGPDVLAGQLARQDPRDTANILAAVARSGHPCAERILAAAGDGRAGSADTSPD
jgi:hypothetical protein